MPYILTAVFAECEANFDMHCVHAVGMLGHIYTVNTLL